MARAGFSWSGFMVFQTAMGVLDAVNILKCHSPLGMESGAIPDSALSASSSYDPDHVDARMARLNKDLVGGAWCPKSQIDSESFEWLAIDLQHVHLITGTETQGRKGTDNAGKEFAEEYLLEYWRPGVGRWIRYRDRLGREHMEGNKDVDTVEALLLDPPIVATKIRFVPRADYQRTVCMRVELFGCPSPDGLLSYSIPQGQSITDPAGQEISLKDDTYDGETASAYQGRPNILFGGVGQLYDGEMGERSYTKKLSKFPPGYGWVGWSNATFGTSVTMKFTFASPRNFSSVKIHANNQYKHGIQVFKFAQVWFATIPDRYTSAPVNFTYIPNTFVETSHWTSIPIDNRIGQYVKLVLHFANKWLLISEVEFEDSPLDPDATLPPPVHLPLPSNGLSPVDQLPANPLPEPDMRPDADTAMDNLDRVSSTQPSTKASDTPALNVSPLGDLPSEYVALIISLMIICFIICAAIAIVLAIRQRKHRKLLASTLSGFIKVPPIERITAVNMKDMQMTINANGSVNPNCYVIDASDCGSGARGDTPPTMTTSNTFETFHFPPLPQPAQRHDSSSSGYAEPDFGKSAATLPLLMSASSGSSFAGCSVQQPLFENATTLPADGLHYAEAAVDKEKSGVSPMRGNYGCLTMSKKTMGSIRELPRSRLKFTQQLGDGDFGEVHLCDITACPELNADCSVVAVKLLRTNASPAARSDFEQEMVVLSKLRHQNIVTLLGACTKDEPWLMVVDYMEDGDLNQYLRNCGHDLRFDRLLHLATQIASGMEYLESLNFVHRDLATRNCLVGGPNQDLKIGDFGMAQTVYSRDYYPFKGRFALPIRWMAWESVHLGKFTPKSDVWSFAVTLWEILTLCHERPFESLSDDDVLLNIQLAAHNSPEYLFLARPPTCPVDMYSLMLGCWSHDDALRPSFHDIYRFFVTLLP